MIAWVEEYTIISNPLGVLYSRQLEIGWMLCPVDLVNWNGTRNNSREYNSGWMRSPRGLEGHKLFQKVLSEILFVPYNVILDTL